MAGVCWGTRCEGFCSKEDHTIALSKVQGTWQSTLFTSLEIPWGFLTQAVLHSLAVLILHKKSSIRGFLWARKVWFTFPRWMFAPETFGERQKGERSQVVSLLPGSRKHLALRNPLRSVPEIKGCMHDLLAYSAKGTRKGTRNQIPVQTRKVQRHK